MQSYSQMDPLKQYHRIWWNVEVIHISNNILAFSEHDVFVFFPNVLFYIFISILQEKGTFCIMDWIFQYKKFKLCLNLKSVN